MLCLCGENNRDNAKFCRDCGRSFKGVYLWLCAIVTLLSKGKHFLLRKRTLVLLRKRTLALIGFIIATTITLLTTAFIPEFRHIVGLDQTVYAYHLKQKYSLLSAEAAGKEVNSDVKTIYIDGETPEGDIDGHITDNLSQTSCQFTGKVTRDMRVSLQCFNSPDRFVNGYIYPDGTIKGDLEDNTSLSRLSLSEASSQPAPYLDWVKRPGLSISPTPSIVYSSSTNALPTSISITPTPMSPSPTPITSPTPGSLYETVTPNVNGNEAIVTPSPVPSQTAPASKN